MRKKNIIQSYDAISMTMLIVIHHAKLGYSIETTDLQCVF